MAWKTVEQPGSKPSPCFSAEGRPTSYAAASEELAKILGPVLRVIRFEEEPFVAFVDEKEEMLSMLPKERLLEVRNLGLGLGLGLPGG